MRPWLTLLPCTLLIACGNSTGTGTAIPEANWEGEVRILPGDTSFVPCGSTVHYKLTGPGLDSIAHRYTFLNTVPGQWIKTWCSGHLTSPGPGRDSVLTAARYMHMDSEVRCPPVPNDSMAGNYVSVIQGSLAAITQQVMLLHGGDAVLTTTAPGSPFLEEDGNWGLDADGTLVLELPQRHTRFSYTWSKDGLISHLAHGGNGPTYEHLGPADRMQGTFGRTARWLAMVATAEGNIVRPEDLRPSMSLDSLFPDPAAKAALRASAGDTLGLSERKLAALWATVDNVKEVNALMRMHIQAAR